MASSAAGGCSGGPLVLPALAALQRLNFTRSSAVTSSNTARKLVSSLALEV
jgi:hypothetical protein